MPSLLHSLRAHAPTVTPEAFLAEHPGCFILFFDDTPAKDPTKALSASTFGAALIRRKQAERCAVCFSLQAFGASRRAGKLVAVRNLGVDVDLAHGEDGDPVPLGEIDRRKDEYLRGCLLSFRLRPHWLIETQHGFHVIYRVREVRDRDGIGTALALNRRLVTALQGDENAVLVTQTLRVPGTLQFKDPAHPFLCRLLLNNAKVIPPYGLDMVENALLLWEQSGRRLATRPVAPINPITGRVRSWQRGLAGVPEGERNAMAACLVGGLLARLPIELWEIGGWGGLKEWNATNSVPLPEQELRAVFESIARRERAKRGPDNTPPSHSRA